MGRGERQPKNGGGLLCKLPMGDPSESGKQGLTSLADVCYLATSMKRGLGFYFYAYFYGSRPGAVACV